MSCCLQETKDEKESEQLMAAYNKSKVRIFFHNRAIYTGMLYFYRLSLFSISSLHICRQTNAKIYDSLYFMQLVILWSVLSYMSL